MVLLTTVGWALAQPDTILRLLLGQGPTYGAFLANLKMRGFMRFLMAQT